MKILAAGVGLQRLKIGVAIDQTIHIDNGTVLNKITDVAAASESDDTARLGAFLQQRDNIHVRGISGPVIVGHGCVYRSPE